MFRWFEPLAHQQQYKLTFVFATFEKTIILQVSTTQAMNLALLPPANEVCEGYVFTGIRLSTGGACVVVVVGACVRHGGCRGAWLQGGMHGCGRHVSLRGACVVVGGNAWLQGVCMVVGVCMVAWGHVWDTTRYGQWAGSMHPTGMHSCD